MKKLFTLLSVALLSVVAVSAQEKVKEVVSADYNRPSVTYVLVDRQWSHAQNVQAFFNTLEIGDKYDKNVLKTTHLNVAHTAGVPVTAEQAGEVINNIKLGNEVVSYIFNRQADGTCDDSILKERGLYNAKDQDMKNLEGSKVKELTYEWGEPLVNASYVVVLDVYETKETLSEDRKTTSYSAKCVAHAFKLAGNREALDNFYMTAWADVTSSEAEKAAAVAAFNELQFNLEHVTSVSVSGSSSKSEYSNGDMADACTSAYENVVYNLEKQITAWKTVVGVIGVNPIQAKIGTKEAVKNGDRFQAYAYKEDKNGELISVKRGMVRATVIADNKGVATGDTKPSYFYQISGGLNIQEGYILQQKNDLKLGAGVVAGIAPNGFRVGLDLDYIAHISKGGCITYAMINAGMNFMDGYTGLFDATIGAGYGIPISRFMELTPFVTAGGFLMPNELKEITDEPLLSYTVEPGARFAATFQPLSIYVSAGYQLNIPVYEGIVFDSGIFAKFGVKWTF